MQQAPNQQQQEQDLKEKEEVGPEASGAHAIFGDICPEQQAGDFNTGAGPLAQIDQEQNAKQRNKREGRWIEDAHTPQKMLSAG